MGVALPKSWSLLGSDDDALVCIMTFGARRRRREAKEVGADTVHICHELSATLLSTSLSLALIHPLFLSQSSLLYHDTTNKVLSNTSRNGLSLRSSTIARNANFELQPPVPSLTTRASSVYPVLFHQPQRLKRKQGCLFLPVLFIPMLIPIHVGPSGNLSPLTITHSPP